MSQGSVIGYPLSGLKEDGKALRAERMAQRAWRSSTIFRTYGASMGYRAKAMVTGCGLRVRNVGFRGYVSSIRHEKLKPLYIGSKNRFDVSNNE